MLGIVRGLQSEAKILAGLPCAVISGGGKAAATRRKIDDLITRGVTGLVSFGIAGGLDPSLRSGDLLLSANVIDADGQVYAGDPQWLGQAMALLPMAQIGQIYASDQIVETTTEKRRLFETQAVLAADMESHHMARAALRHSLPFLVIRSISDRATETLPAALGAGVNEHGATRIAPILLALLTGRLGLVEVIQAGKSASRALRSLRYARPVIESLMA